MKKIIEAVRNAVARMNRGEITTQMHITERLTTNSLEWIG